MSHHKKQRVVAEAKVSGTNRLFQIPTTCQCLAMSFLDIYDHSRATRVCEAFKTICRMPASYPVKIEIPSIVRCRDVLKQLGKHGAQPRHLVLLDWAILPDQSKLSHDEWVSLWRSPLLHRVQRLAIRNCGFRFDAWLELVNRWHYAFKMGITIAPLRELRLAHPVTGSFLDLDGQQGRSFWKHIQSLLIGHKALETCEESDRSAAIQERRDALVILDVCDTGSSVSPVTDVRPVLSQFSNLRELHLSRLQGDREHKDDGLFGGPMQHLQRLTLAHSVPTPAMLQNVAKNCCDSLQFLHLSGNSSQRHRCVLGDAVLSDLLKHLQQLTVLELAHFIGLTGAFVSAVALPKLERLTLRHLDGLTTLAEIGKSAPQLQHLEILIPGAEVPPQRLAPMMKTLVEGHCQELRELRLLVDRGLASLLWESRHGKVGELMPKLNILHAHDTKLSPISTGLLMRWLLDCRTPSSPSPLCEIRLPQLQGHVMPAIDDPNSHKINPHFITEVDMLMRWSIENKWHLMAQAKSKGLLPQLKLLELPAWITKFRKRVPVQTKSKKTSHLQACKRFDTPVFELLKSCGVQIVSK